MSAFGISPESYNKQEAINFTNNLKTFISSSEIQNSIQQKDYYDYSSKIAKAIYSFLNLR
ncbi:MAG: hypothetical protein ACRYE8_00820 [Janthinobacterium lividum]